MRTRKIVKSVIISGFAFVFVCGFTSSRVFAQTDVTELAKKTQNPVADLVTIPFQFNWNSGGGLGDQTFFLLNFQPVLPIKLSPRWNLISRTIVPLANYPGPSGTRFGGFGDIQEQLFFTPAKPGGLIWGLGPVFSVPTATSAPLETGTWAMGPGGVVIKMAGKWVIGGLASQFWPVSDDGGDPETNLFVTQPFINYNFGKGWALATSPIITANWDAPEGEQWTVPIGIGISRTTVFSKRPITLGAQYYHNAERPSGGPENQFRIAINLLYPN
jgi:hypothetical protein